MSISRSTIVLLFVATLLISSVVAAQSPAPAPFSGGGRRMISPSSSKTPSPKSSALPPQADSPSIDAPALSPSSISDSPSEAPAPALGSNAASNRYTVFGGSVAVFLCAAVLAI
ncbi:PREDICTED: classical arabinogalactan protein 1-like [Camelina sativa]|uniref:Classical arabinogalactan protein 1-like n=1 Tax=Camelina sativa TaxID=90675 RepID=A0ABM0XVE8_CAMSA|nr:PREDICTED: classical arabinogalactan protein 1-like [Camelina sativa]